METFYHVSFNMTQIDEFTPRIPQKRGSYENNIMKRICVSNTIENCLIATPTFQYIDYLLEKDDPYQSMEYYFFNKEDNETGIPIVVYEFTGNFESIMISNQEIIDKNYVQDAKLTKEAWFIENIKPTSIKNLLILDYELNENLINNNINYLVNNNINPINNINYSEIKHIKNLIPYDEYYLENKKRVI